MADFTNSERIINKENVDDALQKQMNYEGLLDMKEMQNVPLDFSEEELADPVVVANKCQKILDTLMADFNTRDTWRKASYETIWDECYKLYMSGSSNSKTPTRSKIFIPKVYEAVEQAMPKLISFIGSGDNIFEVEAKDTKETVISENIKKLLADQLDKTKFEEKYQDFVKQLLIYGTSYLFVDWKVERKWVWKKEPVRTVDENSKPKLEWKTSKSYKVLSRRPEAKVIDILDVFPHPSHANVEDGPGVFIRSWMDLKDFQELGKGQYPVFINTKAIKGGSSKLQESRSQRKSNRGEQNSTSNDQVELLEFWGKYDLDGDGIREEVLMTVANRSVLVRAISNPYDHQERPLIKVPFVKVPLEWFGIGLIEPVVALQHELNTLRRQRLDHVNMIINRMWKVLQNVDVDITQLVSRPNGVILVPQQDAVQDIPTQEISQSAILDTEKVEKDIQDATVPAAVTGSTDDLGKTAAGARLIVNQGLEKFAAAARLIESSGIRKMLELMYQLDLQFLDSDEVIQAMYGYLFPMPVTPELIRAQVNFKFNVISEMLGRSEKVNQLVGYYGVAKNEVAPETKAAILKQIYSLLGFDGDDIAVLNLPAADSGRMPIPEALASSPMDESMMGQAMSPQGLESVNVPGAANTII